MVSCHQCSTPNSLDSTFCKKCGTPLAESDLIQAQEKVTAWIAEGNVAFGEGRIAESLAIATSALESNPNYTDALILKSLCYERMGNIAEALAYAEKVVELNPDSELDKIRRNGLRTTLGSVLQVPDSADRRGPIVAGIAAAFCVLSIGAAIMYFQSGAKQSVGKNAAASIEQPVTFSSVPSSPGPAQTTPSQSAAPQPQQANPTDERTQDSNDESPPLPRTGPRGALPVSPNFNLIPQGDVGPQSNPGPASQPAQQPANNGDPNPTADVQGNSTPVDTSQPTAPAKPAEDDPGQIQITVHHGQTGRRFTGGSQPVGDNGGLTSNGVEALSRTGYQQYMVGSFSAAATSFEKALRGGGDPIRLNQRLGQVYSKLGRTSDAIGAYNRAVAACQQALQSGRGDKTTIQATLESCQQAGKVLGG